MRDRTIPVDRKDITGLVLAGGRGSRMGGVDKGLQPLDGLPMAAHALQRLAPQVGTMALNANRHVEAYARLGVPVWPDATGDYAGPLAGMLAGLTQCRTPWLVTVPCDTPRFPWDTVARLAQAIERASHPAAVAMAATRGANGSVQPQPVFCLLHTGLRDSLAAFLAQGQRKIDRWTAHHGAVLEVFEDGSAFFNINTPQDLQQVQGSTPGSAAPPDRTS